MGSVAMRMRISKWWSTPRARRPLLRAGAGTLGGRAGSDVCPHHSGAEIGRGRTGTYRRGARGRLSWSSHRREGSRPPCARRWDPDPTPNISASSRLSSALFRSPVHLELAVMDRTITKVQIDQALVRNTRLFRHGFKIGHSVPV